MNDMRLDLLPTLLLVLLGSLPLQGQGSRTLWELTQHLTTRTEDSHASVVTLSRNQDLHPITRVCQALVRFYAYYRIK